MSTPEEIQEDIEQTRADLRDNVEALQEKVSVKGAASRSATKVKDTVSGVKDAVMGSAESSASSARDAVSSVGDVPDRVRSTTAGNPLAVGLGAFALGWLVSSLIPASERETQAVASLQDSDALKPLQESAQQLVGEAKAQGQQAVQEFAEQAKSSAQTVAEQAKDTAQAAAEVAKEKVQEKTGS